MKGPKPHDLSGQRFGKWIAIKYAGNHSWHCVCECGNRRVVLSWNLRSGHTKRCNQCRQKAITKHRHAGWTRRGIPCSPTYSSWLAMLKRCNNPKLPSYQRYGKRGITVCQRWRDFRNFLADMGKRPKGKTLDRLDNACGYYLSNCRWATLLEQGANKSNNRFVTYRGKRMILAEAARRTGFNGAHLSTLLNTVHWPPIDVAHIPRTQPLKWLRTHV